MATDIIITKGESKDIVLLNEKAEELHYIQEPDSTLRLHILHLSDPLRTKSGDDKITVEQNGKGCTTEISALYCLTGADEASLITSVRHNVGGGTSKQNIKFVLADEAKGAFRGRLYIQPDAQQTSAEQNNRNLLLSDRAVMRTQPELEIYADDVKASHGASTGQLDESSLFYMQQRCISKEQGRRLLIRAFMQDITDGIKDEKIKQASIDAIDGIVEKLY